MVTLAYTGKWGPTTQWTTGLTPVAPVMVAPQPIQQQTLPSVGGNASPLGRPIPTGLGMVVHTGDPIVDPKHLGGYRTTYNEDGSVASCKVNLVFCLLDTLLGSPFHLIWARVNKDFIIRTEAPRRSITSPYRFYGGSQTAVDPVITRYLAAQYRTAWPGFVYIVFEDFDIALYDLTVPVFDFMISSNVTSLPIAQEQSSLTFGAIADYDNTIGAADFGTGLYYQLSVTEDVFRTEPYILSTISIETLMEIRRVTVTPDDTYRDFITSVALQGSDYIVAVKCGNDTFHSTPRELCLISTTSGVIVTKINVIGGYTPFVKRAVWFGVGKYLVFCDEFLKTPTLSGLYVALVDIIAGTMTWLVHPLTIPVGSSATNIGSVDFSVNAGIASVWVTARLANTTTPHESIWFYRLSATGLLSQAIAYTEVESGKYPVGVAYDSTDNTIMIVREDGSRKKVAQDGTVIYTTAATGLDLHLNVGYVDIGAKVSSGSKGFEARSRPGFALASEGVFGGSVGDEFLIDLSDGSVTQVIENSDISNPANSDFHTFDQYTYTMVMPWSTPGVMSRVRLGDTTPDTIDLADIMLALSTFDDRHDASEMAFTGFPGNECYGVKYEADTSIQDALRALREPFDISIVESDAKLKFRWPPRDGAFVADLTLTDKDSLVDRGAYTFEKVAGAEQEALRACEIVFHDKNNYGEPGTSLFARPTGAYDVTHSIDRRSLNLPLYMTASRALQQAALVVYRSVYALESYNGSLGPALGHVEPGDIIVFPFASDTGSFDITAQVKTAQLNANYSQDITAVQYLQAHDATYTGAEIVPQPIGSTPFAWTLSAGSGSYVITGSSAALNLSSAPELDLEPGSYVITGTSASLLSDTLPQLLAGPGSYVITGTSATLTNSSLAKVLTMGVGSYAIAGTDATLTFKDANIASVVLLMGYEGQADGSQTFTDESASGHTFIVGDTAQIDTAQFKFGAASMLLDGTNDNLRCSVAVSPADFQFGSGDFTVEGWFRFAGNLTADQTLVSLWATPSQRSWGLIYRGAAATDNLNLITSSNGTSTGSIGITSSAWTPTVNTWYHIALDRSGNDWRIYVDGTMIGSANGALTLHASTTNLRIGNIFSTTESLYFNGHVDELRISKGVARYGSDGGHTIPTRAWPRT